MYTINLTDSDYRALIAILTWHPTLLLVYRDQFDGNYGGVQEQTLKEVEASEVLCHSIIRSATHREAAE